MNYRKYFKFGQVVAFILLRKNPRKRLFQCQCASQPRIGAPLNIILALKISRAEQPKPTSKDLSNPDIPEDLSDPTRYVAASLYAKGRNTSQSILNRRAEATIAIHHAVLIHSTRNFRKSLILSFSEMWRLGSTFF